MNRISRPSAADAAEALLEVGRTEPALRYDVELGLARHHHWLRSDAPLPEWASASVGTAAKLSVPAVIKTLVSMVLIGTLSVAAWHALDRPQPSAAGVEPSSLGPERVPTLAPSSRAASPSAAAAEAWMATTPIPLPLPVEVVPSDPPPRRTARADVPNKRGPRSQRASKGVVAARSATASGEPTKATSARAAPALPATHHAVEDVHIDGATDSEVAYAPERKPNGAARRARPEPGPRAQAPDDLVEMKEVATAEQLLARSPERALALVRQGDRRFARGYFQQERAYIAIMALIRLGRIEDARARAATFARRFPALPYGARIRSALEAQEGKPPSAAPQPEVP